MRPTRRLLIAAGVLVLLAALLLATCLPAPLAPQAALAAAVPHALPAASPPPEMALYQLPTAVIPRNAAVAYRGGSPRDKRMFAMTAVLVRHPRGDLLIDTGLGRGVEAQFAQLPFLFRALSPYQRKRAAVDQLRAVGYDPHQLRAILLTHAHWDHVSGIPDFPGTPVWVTAEERRYIGEGGVVTVVARSFTSVQYREYTFEPKPYLGFPRSHDVHGDGSVVIVPAPGHTPGSVIIFLTPPSGPRYAMVGDLAWQREGIHERAERPFLLRTLIDSDAESVRRDLLRMFAITQRFPEMHVIPAHDARAFAELPTLDQMKR